MLWFPEYNLGSVMLCNGSSNTFNFCLSIMNDYIKNYGVLRNNTITDKFDSINGNYFKKKDILNRPKIYSCPCDSVFKPAWNKYLGKYKVVYKNIDFKWYVKFVHSLGFGYQNINIVKEDQELRLSGIFGESKLREFLPGLFFTKDGEVLDFRTENPTFKNIPIKKRNN